MFDCILHVTVNQRLIVFLSL